MERSKAMTLAARLIVAVMVPAVVPAAAEAGWSRPHRVAGDAPPPGAPQPAVRLLRRAGPIRVRVRGDRRRTIPGSRASAPTMAAARGGLVAVAWESTTCEDGADGTCDERIVASVWRRGDRPPPGTALESGAGDPSLSSLDVGRDGTVLVSWDLLPADDDRDDDPVGMEAAVGRGTGPLRRVSVAGANGSALGVAEVRGRPQLAWTLIGPRATSVHLADARGGRLGRARLDARIPGSQSYVELVRNRRGDRLLTWELTNGDELLRSGAAGHRLGRRVRRFPGGVGLGLGPDGRFAAVGVARAARNGRIFLARGRTRGGNLRRDPLVPRADLLVPGEPSAAVALDAGGRAFVVWDAPRRWRGRRIHAVVATVTRWGAAPPRARVISKPGASTAGVTVFGNGRAWATFDYGLGTYRSVYRG